MKSVSWQLGVTYREWRQWESHCLNEKRINEQCTIRIREFWASNFMKHEKSVQTVWTALANSYVSHTGNEDSERATDVNEKRINESCTIRVRGLWASNWYEISNISFLFCFVRSISYQRQQRLSQNQRIATYSHFGYFDWPPRDKMNASLLINLLSFLNLLSF